MFLLKQSKDENLAHNSEKDKRNFSGIYLEEQNLNLYSMLAIDQIRPKQMAIDNCRW